MCICMLHFWWTVSLSAIHWALTVLDLLTWKSKEGSFTSLIGSLALQWTAFSYVQDSYVVKCNFVLSVQFHVSFWSAQSCSSMISTFIRQRQGKSMQDTRQMQAGQLVGSVSSLDLACSWLISLSFTDLKVKVPEVSGMSWYFYFLTL